MRLFHRFLLLITTLTFKSIGIDQKNSLLACLPLELREHITLYLPQTDYESMQKVSTDFKQTLRSKKRTFILIYNTDSERICQFLKNKLIQNCDAHKISLSRDLFPKYPPTQFNKPLFEKDPYIKKELLRDLVPIFQNMTHLKEIDLSCFGVLDITPLLTLSNPLTFDLRGTLFSKIYHHINPDKQDKMVLNGSEFKKEIGKLAQIESLNFSDLKSYEDILKHDLWIVHILFPNLKFLDLRNTPIEDLSHLEVFGDTLTFNLNNTTFTKRWLWSFERMNPNHDLPTLNWACITYKEIKEFLDCAKKLENCHIPQITENFTTEHQLIPLIKKYYLNLKSLIMGDDFKNNGELSDLVNAFPALEELTMCCNEKMDFSPLKHLAHLKKVTVLGCPNVDAIKTLEEIKGLHVDILNSSYTEGLLG